MHGALKGSIGVVKCVVAELTDETNMAQGFSLLPMTWAMGYVIGFAAFFNGRLFLLANLNISDVLLSPIIGGILSRPQDRWPSVFSHPFWANYPYLLPCLACAAYACVSLVIVANYLEEVRSLFSTSKEPIKLT
jgi:hypothetical protein